MAILKVNLERGNLQRIFRGDSARYILKKNHLSNIFFKNITLDDQFLSLHWHGHILYYVSVV